MNMVTNALCTTAYLGCLTGLLLAAPAWGQTVVFSDDFSVSQGEAFTTSGEIGTSNWFVVRSGDDFGARIHGGILELTNTASEEANDNGWVFSRRNAGDFMSPYEPILEDNEEIISWTFNMRQIRTNPSGFGSNRYGVAFILAATHSNVGEEGSGYAVVHGGTTDTNPIRLAKFTGGINDLGTSQSGIIVAGSPLDNIGTQHLSIRVTYNPHTNEWNMFGRNDGTSFQDPESGTLAHVGSGVDDEHVHLDMPHMGAFWHGATAADQNSRFDNVTVRSDPPPQEPVIAFTQGFDSVEGGDTATLIVELENEASETVTADIILIDGDANWFTPAYTPQPVTFTAPASDGETETVNVTATDNVVVAREAVFQLDNVAGGPDATIGSPSTFTLTIEPDFAEDLGLFSYWHFNDPEANANSYPDPVLSSFGRGAISYSFPTSDDAAGSSVNARRGALAGRAFTFRGDANNEESFQLRLATLGLESLVLRYALQATSTGFDSRLHEFSVDDGENWTTIHEDTGRPSSYELREFNLRGFEALNDATDVIIRITLDGATGATGRNSFDNITLEGNVLPHAKLVDGASGWRMLSAAKLGMEVQDLADLSLVQGIPGEYPQSACGNTNLFTGYNGDNEDNTSGAPFCATRGFTVPTGLSEELEPGRGFIWFLWETPHVPDEPGGNSRSTGLPLVVAADGEGPDVDQQVEFKTLDRPDATDDWFLIGNPFDQEFDLDGISTATGPQPQSTFQHWDGTTYVPLEAGTDDAGPWDGFFAEVEGHTLPVTFDFDADCREGCPPSAREAVERHRVALALEGTVGGQPALDLAAAVVFAADADDSWDRRDASKLYPMGSMWAILAPMGDKHGEHVAKAVESRPLPDGEVTVPVSFSALAAGEFTVSLGDRTDIPESWSVELHDSVTGQTVDLRTASFSFSVPELVWMDERFELRVTGQAVSTDAPGAAMTFALEPPYPNPLAVRSTVAFTLPEAADVRLAVYDVLGRAVAVLAEGERAAGRHEVVLEGARLASGTYLVRLAAGGETLTRRVTIIR